MPFQHRWNSSKDLSIIRKEWEEKYRYGSVAERLERVEKWQPYYSLLYREQADKPFAWPLQRDVFLQKLLDEKILHPEASVLEIGCGLGERAMEMSRLCRTVKAIDSNPIAVEILKKRAGEAGIRNMQVEKAAWEAYNNLRPFDVVFTSMCPAVCNPEEIIRMESISSGYCALITVMAGSYDKHRRAMMQELRVKPEGMITDFDTYRDVLTKMGRPVRTFTHSYHRCYQTSLEESLKRMPVYFQIFGIREEESRSFIRDYFARNGKEGILEDESQMNLGLLYWKRP